MVRARLAFVVLSLLGSTSSAQSSRPATQAEEPTVVFEGRVVDLRGEGVTLANVRVTTWQEPDLVLAKGVCDGEGYFRIARVPRRDSWQVQATSPGRCSGRASVSGEPSAIVVQVHDAATVRGTLRTREGKPVVGALVRSELITRVLRNTGCDAKTDAEGRFELAGVPLGLVRVAALVPGQGIAEQQTLLAADTELALAPGEGRTTSLQIAVAGLTEGAAAGASVTLLPYASNRLTRLPPPWDAPRLEADGKLVLDGIPDVQYLVSPRCPGYAFAPREIRAEPGKGPHVLEFRATALGAAALRCPAIVRDAERNPVAGAKLALRAANSLNRAEAASGANGTLEFASPLAAGTDVIVESLDDRWVLDQDKPEGSPGRWDRRFLVWHECKVDPRSTLELRVVPACSAWGRVVLATGGAAAFVKVELEEESAARTPRWMTFATTTSKRDGTFTLRRLHHLADRVRVKVEGASGAVSGEPFVLDSPGATQEVGELKLAAPASVEGVVTTADQKPAPGIRVWLRGWDLARNTVGDGNVVEVITDRRGRYRFVGVPAGGALLLLLVDSERPGRAAEPFEVEAGKTLQLDLEVPKR